MAKKYYVVWKGRQTGIFEDWASCNKQVHKFAGARFKSFKTKSEAEAAFSGNELTNEKAHRSKSSGKRKGGIPTYDALQVDAVASSIKIFTDGGCEPNPGDSGSGVAIYRDGQISELWYGLYNANGTNNTAELNALHQGLLVAQDELAKGRSVTVFCDSKYSIQSVTQWAFGWRYRGWTRKGGEVKNLEIIQRILPLYEAVQNEVDVLHVNGHVGIEGNELADRMSMLAIESQETEFARYLEDIDVPSILNLKSGDSTSG